MNIKEFLGIIENYEFSYVNEQDLYFNNFDLNITLKLVEKDKMHDIYYFFDVKKDSNISELKYYYNGVLITTRPCLFGYIMNKPIYLPIPEWVNENGEMIKDYQEKPIFQFSEDEIMKLNMLIGLGVDEAFGVNYLKTIENVSIT